MAAAVEDPAGPATSIDVKAGLSSSIDSERYAEMKNTARKSTAKAAQLLDAKPSSPLLANGSGDGNHGVSNGESAKKRLHEGGGGDVANPAKAARRHLEEMEKAQEEMTRKVRRDGKTSPVSTPPLTVEEKVCQNGDSDALDSSNGHVLEEEGLKGASGDTQEKSGSQGHTSGSGGRRSPASGSRRTRSESPTEEKNTGSSPASSEQQAGESSSEQKPSSTKSQQKNGCGKKGSEINGDTAAEEPLEEEEEELLRVREDEEDHSGEENEAVLLDEPSESSPKAAATDKPADTETSLSRSQSAAADDDDDAPKRAVDSESPEQETGKSPGKSSESAGEGKKEKKEAEKGAQSIGSDEKRSKERGSRGKYKAIPAAAAAAAADTVINLDDDDDDAMDGADEQKKSSKEARPKKDADGGKEGDKEGPPAKAIEIDDDDDGKEKSDVDNDAKSETSLSSCRKRGPPSPARSDASSGKKKSRLDKVIGRLGSAAVSKSAAEVDNATSADAVEVKPDETKVKEEEKKPPPGATTAAAAAGGGAAATETDKKPEVKPDVKADVDGKKTEKKLITLTDEELNELLMKRMNAFLQRSRASLIVQLNARIAELQTAVESWRSQAKKLAKELDEEVARSQRRVQGGNKILRRSMRPDDSKGSQIQAAALQQQGGAGGKVTVRTPPRPGGVPAPSQGIVTTNAKSNNSLPIRLSPAQASQAKGTTVRDLLDKQRSIDPPGAARAAAGQSLQIGGRYLVPGGQIVTRTSLSGSARAATATAASGGGGGSAAASGGSTVRTVASSGQGGPVKGVIDLTDDDDKKADKPASGRTGQQVAVRSPATGGSGNGGQGRPGTVLVQQIPNSGPVIVQQVVSQPMRGQGTTYVYTSARPGSLALQNSSGTSLVRPALVTASAPPALRPAGQLVTLTRSPGAATSTSASSASVTRPPPPLRSAPSVQSSSSQKHPAPLPPQPQMQAVSSSTSSSSSPPGQPPPKPGLKISRVQSGIVLSWNMTLSDAMASILSYQLFAYQETAAPPSTNLWKKVGDVKALPLPMACTLTQFQEGNKYHFAVRAVDTHGRVGPFSDPSSISLTVINVS